MKQSWWEKLIGKQPEPEQEPSLNKQIEQQISDCRKERRSQEERIEQYKKWATDAIVASYTIPADLWYKELENYDAIQNHEKNTNVNSLIKQKCTEIIHQYLHQIKISRKKIELNRALTKKYELTLDKWYEADKKLKQQQLAQSKFDELEKHNQRLDLIQSEAELSESDSQQQMEMIQEEMTSLNEDIEIQTEVQKQMDILKEQHKIETPSDEHEKQLKEMDELIDKVKNKGL